MTLPARTRSTWSERPASDQRINQGTALVLPAAMWVPLRSALKRAMASSRYSSRPVYPLAQRLLAQLLAWSEFLGFISYSNGVQVLLTARYAIYWLLSLLKIHQATFDSLLR